MDALTIDESVDRIEQMIEEGGVHQHVALNAAKVVKARDDLELAGTISTCDLINADGMSLVWASRILRRPVPERVAGIDLMDRVLARAAIRGYPVYFLGARDEIVARAVQVESDRHPGLLICGWRNGYWQDSDEQAVVRDIQSSAPAILLVALPSPKKELFLGRNRSSLGVPFVMGVGGSFDVVAGFTTRAPFWAQRVGLEWLFRLAQEPRRMFGRYAAGNTRFMAMVWREWRRQK